MKQKNNQQLILLTLLLLVSVFWFGFALLSGAADYGGGLAGVVMNAPNAFVWLLPLTLVYIAWHEQTAGSVGTILFGAGTVFFFDTYESWLVFATISLPFLLLGGLLFIQRQLRQNQPSRTV